MELEQEPERDQRADLLAETAKNAAARYGAWRLQSRLLGNLQPGDRLWMVTAGRNLGQEAEQAGFLVAIWQVKQGAPPEPGR